MPDAKSARPSSCAASSSARRSPARPESSTSTASSSRRRGASGKRSRLMTTACRSGWVKMRSSWTQLGIAAVNSFLTATREQVQTVSWLVLLDFADYLQQYLPDVWTSSQDGTNLATLTQAQLDLLTALQLTVVSPSWRNALL